MVGLCHVCANTGDKPFRMPLHAEYGRCGMDKRFDGAIRRACGDRKPLCNTVDGLVTVSYTHLDVYKRQMLDRGMTPEEIVLAVLDGFAVDFLQTDTIGYRCACSRDKVERALISMGKKELSQMAEEQEKSEVTCQFCDKIYTFTRAELQQLLRQAEK